MCRICNQNEATVCEGCLRKLLLSEISRSVEVRKKNLKQREEIAKLKEEDIPQAKILRLAQIILDAAENKRLPDEDIKYARDMKDLLYL